jgi:hypothetical protein
MPLLEPRSGEEEKEKKPVHQRDSDTVTEAERLDYEEKKREPLGG